MLCTVVIMSLHYVYVFMTARVSANQFVVVTVLSNNMVLLVLNVPLQVAQTKQNLNDEKKKSVKYRAYKTEEKGIQTSVSKNLIFRACALLESVLTSNSMITFCITSKVYLS